MKRLQVYMPEVLLENLRLYAQSRGIALAQALRQAGEEFTNKITVKRIIKKVIKKGRQRRNDPLLAMAGMFKTGPTDASVTVDDIYND